MIAFGGWSESGALNDTWVLTHADGVIDVALDIKPGETPNSINLSSNGDVTVAVLSSPDFDARTVSPLTITLVAADVGLRGQGTLMYSFEDVNGDGLADLVVHVVTDALQLTTTSDTRAWLSGTTYDGRLIAGSDFVRVVQ